MKEWLAMWQPVFVEKNMINSILSRTVCLLSVLGGQKTGSTLESDFSYRRAALHKSAAVFSCFLTEGC